MFKGAESFNRPIFDVISNGGNPTTRVTTLEGMFEGAKVFDQDITDWDVTSVEKFDNMFKGALAFNQDIKDWAVTAGTGYTDMFNGASSFVRNLCLWQDNGNFPANAGDTDTNMFAGTKCNTGADTPDDGGNPGTTTDGVICCTCSVGTSTAAGCDNA